MTNLPEFLFTLAALSLFFATLGGLAAAWETWVESSPPPKRNRKVAKSSNLEGEVE